MLKRRQMLKKLKKVEKIEKCLKQRKNLKKSNIIKRTENFLSNWKILRKSTEVEKCARIRKSLLKFFRKMLKKSKIFDKLKSQSKKYWITRIMLKNVEKCEVD